jgi:hypothetical protein
MRRIGKRREVYSTVAQAALLEAKHRKSIGDPGEKRLSPKATGNERLVGKQKVIRLFPVCPQPGLATVRNAIVLFSV